MAKILMPEYSKFNEERPYSERVFDDDNCLIIHFYLKKGQKIPMHTSPSRVIVSVLEGSGRFFYETEENYKELKAGETIIYEREEPHGFQATEDMIVQAVIVPKPVRKIEIK